VVGNVVINTRMTQQNVKIAAVLVVDLLVLVSKNVLNFVMEPVLIVPER